MAITLRTRILVWATSDGESTSFVFDLFASPYWVGTSQPGGIGGHSPNWLSEAQGAALPTGVVVIDGALSATLPNNFQIQVDVPVMPAGHVYKVTMDLMVPCPAGTAPARSAVHAADGLSVQ